MLKVGDRGPNFRAIATDGHSFELSKRLGLCTVVFFFPRAFTPGCTREAKGFASDHVELQLAGANIVGISSDDQSTQCRFAESLKLPFPLIADNDLAISKAYHVKWPLLRVAQRVTYVLGRSRRILGAWHHELAIDRHRHEVLRCVQAYTENIREKSAAYHTEETRDTFTDRRRR